MQYFNHNTDFEQAKQRYRNLAKQMHPDKGDSQQDIQEVQQENQDLLLRLNEKRDNTDCNRITED